MDLMGERVETQDCSHNAGAEDHKHRYERPPYGKEQVYVLCHMGT
jgi:hypothetical protein